MKPFARGSAVHLNLYYQLMLPQIHADKLEGKQLPDLPKAQGFYTEWKGTTLSQSGEPFEAQPSTPKEASPLAIGEWAHSRAANGHIPSVWGPVNVP